MSIVICKRCDAPIDSDFDCECFVEVGNMRRLHKGIVLCERYRERHQDELDREENAGPPEPATSGVT